MDQTHLLPEGCRETASTSRARPLANGKCLGFRGLGLKGLGFKVRGLGFSARGFRVEGFWVWRFRVWRHRVKGFWGLGRGVLEIRRGVLEIL